MNAKQKAERTGIIFLVLLIVSGAALLYRGNDAVALGVAKKERARLRAQDVARLGRRDRALRAR
ncbi:MAG: hypothetical protein SPL46_04855 [Selenomonadaceae bacterium]|nr:hypothetical protein [Selenomonadaceae bacterium]